MQTDLSDHFRFGENWQSFAREVDADRIAHAERGLARLIAPSDLAGKTFLDIGCGSGLSMLAALRMGAESVHGVDLDPASVEAARGLLTHNARGRNWSIEVRSVFDLDPTAKRYDIVYSWGVLHHTGAMWRAIDSASAMVAPGGAFALALYRRTPFCWIWRIEKRLYAHGPRWLQSAIRGIYKAAYVAALTLRGRSARRYIADYSRNRGMKWRHDVHDWLGGYPYESVLPAEVTDHLEPKGFAMERVFENCAGTIGLFGTGCDEFLARRSTAK